jgi:general secretion pathway protein I
VKFSGQFARRTRGFSLLEMLVAVAILGISLAALYQSAGGATRIAGIDENYVYATELARSLLADNAVVPVGGLSKSGETAGGFDWSVEARPVAFVDPAPLEEGKLQEISIVVAWRDSNRERTVVLHSVVAGQAMPE